MHAHDVRISNHEGGEHQWRGVKMHLKLRDQQFKVVTHMDSYKTPYGHHKPRSIIENMSLLIYEN